MKFFAIFCVVGFAAASSIHSGSSSGSGTGSVSNKLSWEPQQEYTFDYEGRLLTGLPEVNSVYTGLGVKCQVKVTVNRNTEIPRNKIFTIQVQDPKYVNVQGKLRNDYQGQPQETAADPSAAKQENWRHLALPSHYEPVSGEALRALTSPAQFELRGDGTFAGIYVQPEDEGEWSVSFKKALAALFQTKSIDIENGIRTNQITEDDVMTYWQTQEEGLDGVCEVDYQISRIPESKAKQMHRQLPQQQQCSGSNHAYVVTKTRNLDSCTMRSTYNFYNPGFFRCATAGSGSSVKDSASGNCEGQWTRSSITRYYACGPSVDQLQVQTIYNEGELEQDIFGEKTERFTSGTSQILRLKSRQQKSVSSVSHSVEGKKKIGSLSVKPQQVEESGSIKKTMEGPYGSESGVLSVGSSEAGSLKQDIQQLVTEIVRQDLTKKPGHGTKNDISMKVMALARSFAKLTKEDIKSVYDSLKSSMSGQQDRQAMQSVVFDTVAMSGTRQAINFITLMVEQDQMTNGQIVSFFLTVPRYLEVPQEQVLEQIFNILKTQQVQRQVLVRNQATLSFSSLIQRACLSSQRNSSYPVYVTGQFCHPGSQIVTEKWIPYLQNMVENPDNAGQLRRENKNLALVALGQLQHPAAIPTLLRHAEENERPQGKETAQDVREAIRLTRQVAVYSLAGSGRSDRIRTIEVLSAILKNQGESREVRIAAFNVMMRMNPELYTLQAIAAMTWRETDKEVLNIVYSTFASLAHQKENPVYEVQGSSIRRKAYLILPLLKTSRNLSSGSAYTGDRLDILGMYYTHIASWTSTEGNAFGVFPSHFYNRLTYLLNRYQYTAIEQGIKLKGADNIIQQLVEVLVPSAPKVSKTQIGQQIMQSQLSKQWKDAIDQLSMESRNFKAALGAMYLNLFEDTAIFGNFQSKNSDELKQKVQHAFGKEPRQLLESMCGQHTVNVVKMLDLVPTRYIVPSEMGFPIRVDVNSPTTLLLKGKLDVICNGSGESTEVVAIVKPDLRALSATSYSGMVKVLSPFTKEYLVTGVEEMTNIDLPVVGEFRYLNQAQELKLVAVTKPPQVSEKYHAFFHMVRPYVVKSAMSSVKPYPKVSNFRVIEGEQGYEPTLSSGKAYHGSGSEGRTYSIIPNIDIVIGESLGLHYELTAYSENAYAGLATLMRKVRYFNYSPANVLRFFFASAAVGPRGHASLRHHVISLEFDPVRSETAEIDAGAKIGYAVKQAKKGQGEQKQILYTYLEAAKTESQQAGPFDFPQWRRLIQITTQSQPIDQVSRHPQRRQQLKQLFAQNQQNIQVGRAVSIDMVAVLKGANGRRGGRVIKTSFDAIKGEDGQKIGQFWSVAIGEGDQRQKTYCMEGKVHPELNRPLPSLDIQALRQHPIQYVFENKVGVGASCKEGQFQINGKAMVSPQQINLSEQSSEAKQYQQLKSRNASLAEISKLASIVREQASTLDHVEMQVDITNMEKTVKYANFVTTLVKSLWWPYEETFGEQQAQRQGITVRSLSKASAPGNLKNLWQVRVNAQSNTISANLTQTGQRLTRFQAAQLPYYAQYIVPFNGLSRAQTLKGQSAPTIQHFKCQMVGGLLKTWEKALIPANLDDCYHVIAADCSYRKSFSVMAKGNGNSQSQQSTAGPKEVMIVAGKTVIELISGGSSGSGSSSSVMVKVNGTVIPAQLQSTQPEYIVDGKGDTIAIVYKSSENAIEVSTVRDDVTKNSMLTVKFAPNLSGKEFVQILVDTSYRGRLCGVCGDLKGDKIQDLRGPKECSYSRPELMVASYRFQMSEGPNGQKAQQCSQLPQEIRQQLQQEQQSCKKQSTIQSKVLKSYEQNQGGSCLRHIHLVIEKPDEVCLSRRPVPDCTGEDLSADAARAGQLVCRPTEQSRDKTVTFTCFSSQSKQGQDLKQRAISGQIINELANLPENFSNKQDLPKGCRKITSVVGGNSINGY